MEDLGRAAGVREVGTALVSTLRDRLESGQEFWLASPLDSVKEGLQMAASVCTSDPQGQMEPLSGRHRAGQEGEDGSYLLPRSPS